MSGKVLKWLMYSGGLIPALLVGPVMAQQTVTGTIGVSIELVEACEVNDSTAETGVSFGDLDFGTQSTLFEQADAQVVAGGDALSVLCSPGAEPAFEILSGTNDADSGSQNHAMTDGTNFVPYSIYTDSSRSNVLDIGTSVTLDGTPDGETPQTLELFGRAFGQEGLVAGTYSDTLNVQLTF